MEIREAKPFWQSKRFWWNFLTLGLGIAGSLSSNGIIDDKAMAIVNPIGNVLLNQLSDGAILTAGRK